MIVICTVWAEGVTNNHKQESSTRMSRHLDYRVANANLLKLKTELGFI